MKPHTITAFSVDLSIALALVVSALLYTWGTFIDLGIVVRLLTDGCIGLGLGVAIGVPLVEGCAWVAGKHA